MTSYTLSPVWGAGAQLFDNSGNVLTGGKIYTYEASTTTPAVTYTNPTGSAFNSNPIIANASGRLANEIWLPVSGAYKFVLKDTNDVLIATYDNIPSIPQPPIVNDASSISYEQGYTVTAGAFTVGATYLITSVGTTNFVAIGAASNTTGILFTATGVGSGTGTAKYSRTVQTKLQETVSLADFGAVGDGITDDTVAIQAAFAVQKPLLWVGSTGNNFKITSSITQTVTLDVIWYGEGATITYTGSHVEYAIRLNDTAGVLFDISNLTLDGSKLCNKVLEVLNNTSNATASDFNATNLFVTRAKRINTFSGGNGIAIRGAFTQVIFNGGGASDCELPAGQGTSGSVGISGITVTWYSTTSYAKRMVINNININKIYSSDLAYQDDQDGVVYFVPDDPIALTKVSSQFVSNNGSSYVNCYGRSIKTQCQNTIVENSYFERTEGLASGFGNGEVDSQTGSLIFENNICNYKNGQTSGSVCNSSSGATYGKPGLTASNNLVYLDSATTLTQFASTFPRDGFYSNHLISGNKIFGKIKSFFSFLCNGDKNYAEISNNYVEEIVDYITSEKALVYVLASGVTTPRFANIIAYGNVCGDANLPALVRDAVAGSSMSSSISAWNNYGFLTDNITKALTGGGLQTNVAARLGKVAAETGRAYFKVLSVNIESGTTAIVPIQNASTSIIVFINTQYSATSYAIFANSSTANTVINKGATFEFGNTTNPGTGVFNIWTSATNEISIQNTDASIRTFSLFIMNT